MNENLRRNEYFHQSDAEHAKKRNQAPIIKFRRGSLIVSFNHDITQSSESYEAQLNYYQRRYSLWVGEIIPKEEIVVKPSVGEAIPVTTTFVVKPGAPLYIGLEEIHTENPVVLPKLIDYMQDYQEIRLLDRDKEALVLQAINGLREITEPKDKPEQK